MVKGKKNVMRGNRRTKRVKRTKRTKRTQINRRTKRTKRLSRKTRRSRRSRRMRGGMGAGPAGGTGQGGVEETIQIGNERFRPPNDYEKGDGARIIGYRVCVEMDKGSEFWDTGKIISFEKATRGASSHTIKFDNNVEVTPGVKLMRGKTTTDPEKKNWKILSLQYTREQLQGNSPKAMLEMREQLEKIPAREMPGFLEAFGAPIIKSGDFERYVKEKAAEKAAEKVAEKAEKAPLEQAQRAIEGAKKAAVADEARKQSLKKARSGGSK